MSKYSSKEKARGLYFVLFLFGFFGAAYLLFGWAGVLVAMALLGWAGLCGSNIRDREDERH